MNSWKSWRWWMDYFLVVVGASICGLAISTLLEPNDIVPGGITGLAMILKDRTGLPYGPVLLAMNIPLMWAAWRYLGGRGGFVRTVVGVVAISVAIEIFSQWPGHLTSDRLLVIFYGGLLSGVGLALVFRGRGTTGGTDILGRLIDLWFDTGVGQAILGINVLVFGLAAAVYGLEPAAVALLLSFVMSRSLDAVLHGLVATRAGIIVTEHPAEVNEAIQRYLRRGSTLLPGRGGYSGRDYGVLYIVVGRAEVPRLKRRVLEADPAAFLTLYSPKEVIGASYTSARS